MTSQRSLLRSEVSAKGFACCLPTAGLMGREMHSRLQEGSVKSHDKQNTEDLHQFATRKICFTTCIYLFENVSDEREEESGSLT